VDRPVPAGDRARCPATASRTSSSSTTCTAGRSARRG
jgi:hypothetical protein